MLKKLKAVLTAGVVGAGGGALFGAALWILDQMGNVQSPTTLLEFVLGGTALGGSAAVLFALGLALYGRLRGGRPLSRSSSMALGAVAAPLAWLVIALAAGQRFAGWEIVDWAAILAVTAFPGSVIGRILASVARREDEPEVEAMTPRELPTPDPVVESAQAELTQRRSSQSSKPIS